VPHHVRAAELGEVHVLDAVEDLPHHPQPAARAGRQVHLRHVAGDDDLRPEPEAGQEHLHLFR
jgi:hypothetical protein